MSDSPDCKLFSALYPVECGCTTLKAPASFSIQFSTTIGNFTVGVIRDDAPIGADRLFGMASCGYLGANTISGNENGFFRVLSGFVVQWGIAGNVSVSGPWENLIIPNDKPNRLSNVRGTLAYAAEQDSAGKACNRTTQLYINFGDNSRLDALGFTPIGKISEEDMSAVVDKINPKWGQNPDQDSIYELGNSYLQSNFPGLDYAKATTVFY